VHAVAVACTRCTGTGGRADAVILSDGATAAETSIEQSSTSLPKTRAEVRLTADGEAKRCRGEFEASAGAMRITAGEAFSCWIACDGLLKNGTGAAASIDVLRVSLSGLDSIHASSWSLVRTTAEVGTGWNLNGEWVR